MTDHATPNLPSRNFDASIAFYTPLGFETAYRSAGWLILQRGTVQLEFFPWTDLDPYQNNRSCCIRLDDLDAIIAQCAAAGVPARDKHMPRYSPPRKEASGLTIAYLIDPDGTLIRLIQNP